MKPRYMNLRWLRRSITRESRKGWPKRVRYCSLHRRGISGDMTMVLSFLAQIAVRVAADSRNGRAPCVRLCCDSGAT